MSSKPKLMGLALFAAGFFLATAIMYGVFANQEARADQYSCIRTDLDAQGMTGNMPDPEFTITYDVPSCYATNGYHATRAYMYGDQVAVHYSNQ